MYLSRFGVRQLAAAFSLAAASLLGGKKKA